MVDEAFELDRSHLRAVLLALRAALRDLVVVELALDPVELAMEGVHDAPEDVRQIVFEAGVAEKVLRGREDPDHGAAGLLGLRERSRIRVILVGAVAEERQLVEEVGRRRGGMRLGEIIEGI